MAQFLYDSSYDPPAPVMEFGLGLPREATPRRYMQGLVDSGADVTVIPIRVLTEISAKIVDRRFLSGVTGNRERVSLYQVVIHMPTGVAYGIRAVATKRSEEAILGRDVLNQWRITLDGPGETVEITP